MDGNMRRLPPWMLDGASRPDNKNVEVKRKQEPEAPKTKAEKRPRRTVKPKERDDSEEPRQVGVRRRGRKIEEVEAMPSIEDGQNPETIQSVTGPGEDVDLTVNDLLSFAQEYVKGEEDETEKERESLSVSESVVVMEESNMRSSQGGTEEPNGTRDSTTEDMLDLLLGPFFKKSQQ